MKEITTPGGQKVTVQAISQVQLQGIGLGVEEEYRGRGEPLDAPTYTVTAVDGHTETHTHDATTATTDEDKAAWTLHMNAKQRLEAEKRQAQAKFMMLKGIVASDPSPAWIAEQKYFKIKLPDDPVDLKLQYIQSEILRTPEDITCAIMEILVLSSIGVPKKDLEAVKASFRSAMAELSTSNDLPAEGRVGDVGAIPGNNGGAGVAHDACSDDDKALMLGHYITTQNMRQVESMEQEREAERMRRPTRTPKR
jgi:hypothetical protein